jgi:putative solute:sodium symporter small subunit
MSPANLEQARRIHWRKNRRLTVALLVVWFAVTFVVAFFARQLSFTLFGWPFSFWVASQGALIVYCLIVWIYATVMDRLDDEAAAQADSGHD